MSMCGAVSPADVDPATCLSCPGFEGCTVAEDYFTGFTYEEEGSDDEEG